jgi:tetrapyrrole methylase family protein/MazG family protein
MATDPKAAADAFFDFVSTVKKLRDPDSGCPWDIEQSHESIRPYLIEEAYEVLQAIDGRDDEELKKELGDLLLQVVLHCQIAADRGAFTAADVVQAVNEKMIRRHPHVFGDTTVKGSGEVLKNWEQIKLKEKSEGESVLSGIPKALPALNRAQRLGEKAARFNFDWESLEGVVKKVEEEFGELRAEMATGDTERIGEELGDLFFALAQLGRWMGVHSEDALRACCDRFTERFKLVEQLATGPLKDLSVDQLEELWQEAKRSLTSRGVVD